MKLRVTDAKTDAVEFEAASVAEFTRAINIALLELSSRTGSRTAELQVRADAGLQPWVGAEYPHSAAPLYCSVGRIPLDAWEKASRAHASGNEFERGMTAISSFVRNGVRQEVYPKPELVKPDE